MNDVTSQKGEVEWFALIVLAILALAGYGGYALWQQESYQEREGTIKTDDCREVIQLSSQPKRGVFTCQGMFLDDGQFYKTCRRVELLDNGACVRAVTFFTKPAPLK